MDRLQARKEFEAREIKREKQEIWAKDIYNNMSSRGENILPRNDPLKPFKHSLPKDPFKQFRYRR